MCFKRHLPKLRALFPLSVGVLIGHVGFQFYDSRPLKTPQADSYISRLDFQDKYGYSRASQEKRFLTRCFEVKERYGVYKECSADLASPLEMKTVPIRWRLSFNDFAKDEGIVTPVYGLPALQPQNTLPRCGKLPDHPRPPVEVCLRGPLDPSAQ